MRASVEFKSSGRECTYTYWEGDGCKYDTSWGTNEASQSTHMFCYCFKVNRERVESGVCM